MKRELPGECDIPVENDDVEDTSEAGAWGGCDTDPWDGPAGEFAERRKYILRNRQIYSRDPTGEYPDLPPKRMSIGDDLHTDVCPWCHRCDDVLNIYKDSWAVCHRHRARWCIGWNSAAFCPQGGAGEAESLRNTQMLAGYAEVDAVAKMVPELCPDVEYALHVVLDRLWDEAAAAYGSCPQSIRSDHLFRYLHDIDRWMNGV